MKEEENKNNGIKDLFDLSVANLTNLNEDPQLSGKLFYDLTKYKIFRIGKKSDLQNPGIVLNSIGIQPKHAKIESTNNIDFYISPECEEAIQFLMMYDVIKINEFAEIEVIINSPKLTSSESEVAECYKKAELVGKWLANSGSSQSIFINLGIKP